MKKLIAIVLVLSMVLVGCTTPDSDSTASSVPDLTYSAPSEDQSSQTDPTDNLEGTNSGPGPSATMSTSPSVQDPSENGTEGTEGSGPAGSTEGTDPTDPTQPQATEKPTIPTNPPEDTKPTTPPETKPTEPPATEPEETTPPATDPPKEDVDPAVIAAQANSYAVSLGFVVDGSLNKGNAGYYSPDYRPIATNEVGIAAAKDLVSATKNQLNSRFSEGYSPTLVESIFGLVRVNCVVEYSHTDELGNWYYIYVFYG